jgi:hypothetical protein
VRVLDSAPQRVEQEGKSMSTGVIALIVVLAVVIVAAGVAVAAVVPRQRSRRLMRQFGPEYERVLAHHGGDRTAAEQALQDRNRRAGELDIHPLGDAQRERYLAQWTQLQEQFVDSPAKAVIDAGRLLNEVLRDRGFPEDDQDAVLSVYHGNTLPAYRTAQRTAERAGRGEDTTEELRATFVQTREAFDDLLNGGSDQQPTTGKAGAR